MAALSAAARTSGVASTSYEAPRSRHGRWQQQHMLTLRQQQRCQAAAAPAVMAGSSQQQQQQQHQQQQPPKQQRAWQQPGRSSRRRLPVCYSFNLPEGFGESWRRLSGGTQQPQQGPSGSVASSSDEADRSGDAAGELQQPSVWSDWQADATSQDWEEWEGLNVADLDDSTEVAELREAVIERRRMRGGRRRNVRDEYIRPIVDAQGIINRLAIDEAEVEERVFVEAITNQYESREAVKYAGTLIAVPLLVGFLMSRAVAQPVWSYAESLDSSAFAPSDAQKVEGAHELHVEELRLRMEASIGQSPPLTDAQIHEHLHHEALKLQQEFREANKRSMLNVVSDTTSAAVFFIMLARQVPQRQILFRTLGRVFTGLSDTAKAFLIILTTDILLGYHSEEGWTAFLRLFSGHYGLEAEDEALKIFVATVPVFFDTLFKVWIFIGLNKQDPAAAVTLKQMDRH